MTRPSHTWSPDTKIIGGGASGIFASIRCAELARENSIPARIQVLESTSQFLRKVKISGGGRCNVTHHIYEPRSFSENYPRGRKELLSPFQKFQAQDMVNWLKARGITLKHEADGRMFPTTNQSQTIINCLLGEAERLGVELKTNQSVTAIEKLDNGKFALRLNQSENLTADSVLLATGSVPAGYRLAESLGHHLTEMAPSLFTFKIQDPLIKDLPGISFPTANLTLKVKAPEAKAGKSKMQTFRQKGPLLITHWGLSGPALLKLSAWAAREMKRADYQVTLVVNWLGRESQEDTHAYLSAHQNKNLKSLMTHSYPREIPKRFWLRALTCAEIVPEKHWSDLSKKETNILVTKLFASELQVTGKSRYKEEFVECGGINLKEIDFQTMQSKICPGLFFAGELMDVDGITGGFNFQHAWTSGWIAGSHLLTKLT